MSTRPEPGRYSLALLLSRNATIRRHAPIRAPACACPYGAYPGDTSARENPGFAGGFESRSFSARGHATTAWVRGSAGGRQHVRAAVEFDLHAADLVGGEAGFNRG